jgi:hypothetical protein
MVYDMITMIVGLGAHPRRLGAALKARGAARQARKKLRE